MKFNLQYITYQNVFNVDDNNILFLKKWNSKISDNINHLSLKQKTAEHDNNFILSKHFSLWVKDIKALQKVLTKIINCYNKEDILTNFNEKQLDYVDWTDSALNLIKNKMDNNPIYYDKIEI